MRKHLSFTKNSQGFILFHVLFIISLSFLIIMTSIEIYRNNLYITQRQIDNIQFETLFQMGQTKLRTEIQHAGIPEETLTYQLPIGIVNIEKIETIGETVYFDFMITIPNEPVETYTIQYPVIYSSK